MSAEPNGGRALYAASSGEQLPATANDEGTPLETGNPTTDICDNQRRRIAIS